MIGRNMALESVAECRDRARHCVFSGSEAGTSPPASLPGLARAPLVVTLLLIVFLPE